MTVSSNMNIDLTPYPIQIFSNHLIFTRVIAACGVPTLKSIRLVCFAWYRDSLAAWREKCVVHLGAWDCARPEKHLLSPEEFLSLYTSSKNILQLSDFPYQNFMISSWNVLEKSDRYAEEAFFWEICGPTIKYLVLSSCTFTQFRFFMAVCTTTPNLRHLVINQYGGVLAPGQYPDWPHYNLMTLEVVGNVPFQNWKFLGNFPKLENLKLRDFSRDFLFDDIRKIRVDSNYSILNLRHLDVIDTYQRHQGLVECLLPLENLSLRLERDFSESDFREILDQYGQKLKSLKLFRFPIARPSYVPFHDFPFNTNFDTLTELQMWGNVVSTLNFLKKMPNLRKLLMDFLCFEKHRDIRYWRRGRDKIAPVTDAMKENEEALTTESGVLCSRLEYFQIDFKFGVESMQTLGAWMPNLKILKTILCNDTLRVVFSQWSKLKELKLMFGSDVNDQGITGVVENGQQSYPNLTDLKELTVFEFEAYCGESKLTDTSASAFLNMNSLNTLKICVSEQMSQDCEHDLQDKIKNIKLYRNCEEKPHFNEIKCCRRVAFLEKNASLPVR